MTILFHSHFFRNNSLCSLSEPVDESLFILLMDTAVTFPAMSVVVVSPLLVSVVSAFSSSLESSIFT